MAPEDPLSDVLALVKARSVMAGGLDAGGPWAIRFPPPDSLKFFIAAHGSCWITLDGAAPLHLAQGDVFLLVTPVSFCMGSHPDEAPIPAAELYRDRTVPYLRLGAGGDFFLFGGHVDLDSATGRLLLDSLPPYIHLTAANPEAPVLHWLIERLAAERRAALPGAHLASAQLAQLVFLHALRGHLATAGDLAPGRLKALSDPRISPAIRAIHADPAHPWHLADLARLCAMSRTVFADYFKAVAGIAPLGYLTEWRMRLAERALRDSDASVATLSLSLGYSSESAFSNAFKRIIGLAPTRYRLSLRPAV